MPHSHDPLDHETGDRVSIDDLMSDLRSSGQRATTARRAVLEQLVDDGEHHLSADVLPLSRLRLRVTGTGGPARYDRRP